MLLFIFVRYTYGSRRERLGKIFIDDEADLPTTDSDTEDLDYLESDSSTEYLAYSESNSRNFSGSGDESYGTDDSDDSSTQSDEGLFDESESEVESALESEGESEWNEGASEPIGKPGSLNMPIEVLRSIQRDLENIKETQQELISKVKPIKRRSPRKVMERPLTSESGVVRGSLKGMLKKSDVSKESEQPKRSKGFETLKRSRKLAMPEKFKRPKKARLSETSKRPRKFKTPKRQNIEHRNRIIPDSTTRKRRKWPQM